MPSGGNDHSPHGMIGAKRRHGLSIKIRVPGPIPTIGKHDQPRRPHFGCDGHAPRRILGDRDRAVTRRGQIQRLFDEATRRGSKSLAERRVNRSLAVGDRFHVPRHKRPRQGLGVLPGEIIHTLESGW